MQITRTANDAIAPNKPDRALVVSIRTNEELLAMPGEAYMNDTQLEFFRCKLPELENVLSGKAKIDNNVVGQAHSLADPADRASAEEEHTRLMRTAARNVGRLSEVKQALELIRAGSYGWCEDTVEAIGLPRLLARPTTTLSVEALERREALRKFRN
jgi:DnaK suppressor protein